MNLKTVAGAALISLAATAAYAQQPAAGNLKPVKQIDSVWNGVLIGAGAGVAGAYIFTRVECGPRGHDNECSAIAELAGLALFVPSGALAGGIIDRLINKTLPPGANAHATLAPVLSARDGRKNPGVALKLHIRF